MSHENPYQSPQAPPGPVPIRALADVSSQEFAGTRLGLLLTLWAVFLTVALATFGDPVLLGSRILAEFIVTTAHLLPPFFCLTVPEATGARKWAVATAVLFSAFGAFWVLEEFTPFHFDVLGILVFALPLGIASFVLFVRRVSLFVGRTDLARRATEVLIFGITAFAFIMGAILGMESGLWGFGRFIEDWVLPALMLLWTILYTVLIYRVRRALRPSREPALSAPNP